MTRVIRGTGRAIVLAGLAAAAAVAVSACGAGQVTQTSDQVAAVPGFSLTAPVAGGGSVGVRNITVDYSGAKPYAKGASAPLALWIFNETAKPVDVEIKSTSGSAVTIVGGAVTTITPSPSASAGASAAPSASASVNASASASPAAPSASVSASASPTAAASSAPAGKPAKVTIPANGYVVLSKAAGAFAQINGLTEELVPGASAQLTFTFSNGVSFDAEAPVGSPLSPLPRTPIEGIEHE
ncbi:hypothetical protein F4553_004112 [Allocatelliglobosispora scoriae]|uniref:Copper chaperone PCu(A)C n=1 Tax=Allocatelliglobosispora scoriae TaxID=643052 RepID=A0A841BUZ4_9ACTN|nr:hypothetical protein [Allocatelliglobosispora scoriae]MBB5870733.1 hypothetical protein [Allocatelliglobosispora scoriae]